MDIFNLFISLIAISLSAAMHGTVENVSYEPSGNSTVDQMFQFFVGISTIAFLFGVQSVQPDIQASLADKPNPKKEVKSCLYVYLIICVKGKAQIFG